MSMDIIHKLAFALTIIGTVASSAANIQIGTMYSDTYMTANVIIAYDKMGLKMCGRRCIYQDQCAGINYNPNTLVCELLNAGGTSEFLSDYIYSPINTWTMDSDTCHTNQCDNTRKCVKTKSNGHACVKISTPCDGVVCENGGTCKNGVTSFTCLCVEGFTGTYCETHVCDSSPCANEGTCSASGTLWNCQCPPGYTGTTCQTPVCDSSLCGNGGTCSVSESSWSCQCSPGYTGTTCQICSFDSGWCTGWQKVSTGQMNWIRTNGSTPSGSTGPTSDHTLGTSSGSKARFKSGVLAPSTSLCLQFYYHMYGDNMGTLRVSMKTTTGETILWDKTGNQGATWFLNRINITGSSYEIVFDGIRGNGPRSDMAVDDLMLMDGAC